MMSLDFIKKVSRSHFSMTRVCLVVFCLCFLGPISASVKTPSDQLSFFVNDSNDAKMILTEESLGLSGKLCVGTHGGNSTLELEGSMGLAPKIYHAGTNTLGDECLVLANTSEGDILLHLPDPSDVVGRRYLIKKISPVHKCAISSDKAIDGGEILSFSSSHGHQQWHHGELVAGPEQWYTLHGSGNILYPPASDNLMLKWTFDDINGTTVVDGSRHGRDGSWNSTVGLSLGKGVSGNCVHGVNNNTYIETSIEAVENLDSLSISLWYKTDEGYPAAAWQSFIVLYDDVYTSANIGLGLKKNGDYRIRALGWEQGGHDDKWVSQSWTHLTLTWNNIDREFKMYINGQLGKIDYSNKPSAFHTDGFSFDKIRILHRPSSGQYLNGSLDEVRVYDRVLSADEAKMLYEVDKPVTYLSSE